MDLEESMSEIRRDLLSSMEEDELLRVVVLGLEHANGSTRYCIVCC
tara:strand:+ start:609 stop:746 length:138 start_codon:yes stop_codon:yes gene_type:complete